MSRHRHPRRGADFAPLFVGVLIIALLAGILALAWHRDRAERKGPLAAYDLSTPEAAMLAHRAMIYQGDQPALIAYHAAARRDECAAFLRSVNVVEALDLPEHGARVVLAEYTMADGERRRVVEAFRQNRGQWFFAPFDAYALPESHPARLAVENFERR